MGQSPTWGRPAL